MREPSIPRRGCQRHFYEYKGEKLTVLDMALRTGLLQDTIHVRLRRGWSVERILTTPNVSKGDKHVEDMKRLVRNIKTVEEEIVKLSKTLAGMNSRLKAMVEKEKL
jgi:hypothetical protein